MHNMESVSFFAGKIHSPVAMQFPVRYNPSMDKLTWSKLFEVNGRANGEMLQSYLRAHGIDTEIFYEAIDVYRTGITFGRVQIFVPNDQLKDAQKLYAKTGWNMDIADDVAEGDEE